LAATRRGSGMTVSLGVMPGVKSAKWAVENRSVRMSAAMKLIAAPLPAHRLPDRRLRPTRPLGRKPDTELAVEPVGFAGHNVPPCQASNPAF
jgi:hypothetical protein